MINKNILHYKITDKLGAGGMGIVYLAEDTRLKRRVAIKFLPPQVAASENERKRFEIEAQAAAALNHPNIATIFAIEEADDQIFIVMEYIEGQELREMYSGSQETNISVESALDIFMQIADGLDAAHSRGIIHRDIKSSNIMISPSGQIKIMDFGLAKIEGSAQVTQAGTTLGTAVFMSPEQIKGESATQQSDIWALGIIMYEMITGNLPFTGTYEQAIMYAIMNENPEPITQYRQDIPERLIQIISKCLEKKIDLRYQTVADLRADLNASVLTDRTTENIKTGIIEKPDSTAPVKEISRYTKFIIPAFILIMLIFFISQFGSFFQNDSGKKHLLILPFNNIGGDKSRESLCEGLLEILTSKMTELEQFHGSLWVVPTSEVLQNKLNSPGQAYKIFGANLAVTGSLQRLNEIYQLTLNLIDAKELRQLSSAVISVEIENLADMQLLAAEKLMNMLNIEVNPNSFASDARETRPASEAYEAFLNGRGHLQRYQEMENIRRAIIDFKSAIRQDEKFAAAYAGLGEAYWRAFESDKNIQWIDSALTSCKQAVSLNDKLVPVKMTLGLIHSGSGEYRKAIDEFQSVIALEPQNAAAHRGLAKTYEAMDMLDKAEQTYQKAIELKPDYWAGYNDLGVFYFHQSRYEEAIVQFKKITLLTPENHRGFNNLGGLYYMTDRYSEAREMFEKSLALKKTYRVCSNLGTLYFIEGNYHKSARMYGEALKINQSDYLIWGNYAEAQFWAGGKREIADQNYRKAIELAEQRKSVNPNDADILSNLASYYASIGEMRNAVKHIRNSLEIAPGNTRVQYRAGTVYEIIGNRKTALHWIETALENGYSEKEIRQQPELQNLVNDPEYQEIAARLKNKSQK